jgi:hypothetical protein
VPPPAAIVVDDNPLTSNCASLDVTVIPTAGIVPLLVIVY